MTSTFVEAMNHALRECRTRREAVERYRALVEQFFIDAYVNSGYVIADEAENKEYLSQMAHHVDEVTESFSAFLRNNNIGLV